MYYSAAESVPERLCPPSNLACGQGTAAIALTPLYHFGRVVALCAGDPRIDSVCWKPELGTSLSCALMLGTTGRMCSRQSAVLCRAVCCSRDVLSPKDGQIESYVCIGFEQGAIVTCLAFQPSGPLLVRFGVNVCESVSRLGTQNPACI